MHVSRLFATVFACAVVAAVAPGQAPSNNECAAATVVTDGVNPAAPFGASGSFFTNVAATNSANFGTSCAGAGHFNKDVFFQYVATCTGTTTFSTCTPPGFAAGTLADTVLDVYAAATCPGGGTALACNDQFCGASSETSVATTAGTTYYVRVGAFSSTASGTFYLSVRPAGPANDECAGAAALAVGSNAGSTACATPSNGASCTGFTTPVADVWHAFTPAANCVLEITLSGAGANRLGLYTGACGAAQTVVECDSSAVFDVQTTATAGTTYFVRVGRSTAPGADTSYAIVVDCAPLGGNDACSAAIPVADGINPGAPSGAPGLTFTNFGATESPGFGTSAACAGAGHPGTSDVFFSYAATVDGPVRVSLCTPAGFPSGTLADSVLEVFDASACPGGGVALACNDQSCGNLSEVVFVATFGTTYYFRVSSWSTNGADEGSFYLTIDSTLNEDCATAQPVGAGVVHGTTRTAAPSLPFQSGDCYPFNAQPQDVWYAVTPTFKCDLSVQWTGSGADFVETYDGACAAPHKVSCSVVPGLFDFVAETVPGTTYFIRVGQSNPANTGPFTLQISCPTPPPNDECANAIAVFDGVNPAAPFGDPQQTFDNFGATSAANFGLTFNCAGGPVGNGFSHSDVFFSYAAACTGPVRASLCAPPGFSANPGSGKLEIYGATSCPNGFPLPQACGNLNCGGTTAVVFAAVAGQTYLLRVGQPQSTPFGEFAFHLSIDPEFCLAMDAPAGPGSFRLRHVSGPPNGIAVTIVTVFAGAFPNGPYFGIDPSFTEIALQATVNAPPFLTLIDAQGNASFGPLFGAPPITLYAVAFALTPLGQIAAISPPTSFAIP